MGRVSVRVDGFIKKWHFVCGLSSVLLGLFLFVFPTDTFFHMELDSGTDKYNVNGAGMLVMLFGLFAAIAALIRYNHDSKPVMKSFIFVVVGVVLALVPNVITITWQICVPELLCFPFLYWMAISGTFMAIFASLKIMIRSCRSD